MGRQVNHNLIRCHRTLLCLSLATHVLFRLLVVAKWRPEITFNKHSAVLQVFWDRPTRDEYRKAEETIRGHFSKLELFLAARIPSLCSKLAFIPAYARFAWNDTPTLCISLEAEIPGTIYSRIRFRENPRHCQKGELNTANTPLAQSSTGLVIDNTIRTVLSMV